VKRRLKTGLVLSSLAALAGGLVLAVAFHEASSALHESRRQAAESTAAFQEIRLDRRAPSGYETLGSPARFRDAVAFQGRLYICASAGLFAYDFHGVEQARYRPGFELPASKLVAVSASPHDLYVATETEGLLVFDGQSFRQIRPNAAAQRKLTAVSALETGRVLVGTQESGVLAYDGRTWTPFHASLAATHVTALAGNEGDLWVGTLDRGVLHWRGGQAETFTENSGLPDPEVLSLALHGTHAYVGTPLGVAEFEDGRARRTLAPGVLSAALLVHGNSLLIGTIDQGTVTVPLAARGRPTSQEVPKRVARFLELDGEVYTLADDALYRGAKPVLQSAGATLADGNISALAADSRGRLWVGYFDRGLDIVSGSSVQHVEDEHAFCINRIVNDASRGVTAVATANGLIIFDSAPRLIQVMTQSQGLISNHVNDVLLEPGAMTIATPAGITLIDAAGARSLYAFHGLVNNHVYALARAGSKTLAGTLGGISVLEGDRPGVRYTTANSPLKQNWITAIAGVGADEYIGTYGAGIVRLTANGVFEPVEGNFEVNPLAMVTDGDRIYAGTLGRGLYIYDRSTGRGRFSTVGLPSGNVTALAARGGILYIGTDNGLIRVPEAEIVE